MKPNRSNKFTTGLCNTFSDSELRCFFFELDKEHLEHYDTVIDVFDDYELDYILHKTGSGGYHWISPTMITKLQWREMMSQVRHINPKCPMTTLRVEPNKHPNEDMIWYTCMQSNWKGNIKLNSREMCFYLNKIFGTQLTGEIPTTLKIVRYPLPL